MDKHHLQCWNCKDEPTVSDYLDGLVAWQPQIEALQHVCRICGYKTESQLVHGKIVLGYIYAAGTARFSAMQDVPVPQLAVSSEDHDLVVTLGEQAWRIPRTA